MRKKKKKTRKILEVEKTRRFLAKMYERNNETIKIFKRKGKRRDEWFAEMIKESKRRYQLMML